MRTALVASALFAAAVLATPSAHADESIIKNPGDHPRYRFEAEPHGLLGFWGPFSRADFGAGFRGTVVVLDNGFVPSINNSIGVTFGGDLFFRRGTVLLPVAMQWNFWLTTHWSVFGEPGLAVAVNTLGNRTPIEPIFMAGGRFHFNDRVALTMRIGYPSLSVGVSFFL